jgi:hypothetical protein
MQHAMVASTTSLWVWTGLVAAVVLAATTVLARAHGRRLERRMAAELGRRWDEHRPSPPEVACDPAGPDAELRITLVELLEQRDQLLEEFQDVQSRIRILKREVERRQRLVAVDDHADIITLHDAEPQQRPAN